ncbi:hypothetical protein [Streptomyces cyaneofuscatus]|uniref:hypothetical protein n=1 Tax=Streptomyces cyaneofuscatus TaxID=66883 RepID=UPI0038205CB7
MPEKPAQHWTESLFDSVTALYQTAREYQIALRAAQAAVDTVDIDRRRHHEGRIALEGRTNAYGRTLTREPHERALYDLCDTYGKAAAVMRSRYQEAALLYASGTSWAIRSVLRGEHPPVVAFQTDGDGDLVPHAMYTPELDRYSGAADLNAAYDAVRRCMDADEYGEELAGRDYVTEHEAGEMFHAHDIAAGLPQAAFALGLLLQRALNWSLLEPRRAHALEIALAAAEAQRTENA